MSILVVGLVAAALALPLGATRDVSSTAKTPQQIRALIRAGGWGRGVAVVLWFVLALAAMLALSLSRVCLYGAVLAGIVFAAIAWQMCRLADGPQPALPGGG